MAIVNGLLRAMSFALVALCSSGVHAQTYPERQVRLLVPYGAGSSTDQLARILGDAITAETKQPVLVDNRPGAEGFIGVQAAAAAAPDGYTILVTTNSTQVINVHLYKKLPYDPLKDFIGVRTLGQSALGMTVNAASPYQNVAQVLDAARRTPGKLTFGSATATTRLAGEMLKQLAGVQLLNVPYRANAATVTALLGREIDMMFSDTALVIPHARPGGPLRILGVTGQQRMPALPEVPTLKEAGIADYYLTFWYATWVPAGTPATIVARVNDMLAKAMRSPAAQAFLTNGGAENFEVAGDALTAFQVEEIARFGRLVKAANMEPQ
jgi:tripartite-type tricarboxylate transporter receptor subunit TctC